jgi:hypothetical protein
LKKEFPYIVVLANNIRKPAHIMSWLLVLITLASGFYFAATHLSLTAVPLLLMLAIMIVVLIFSLRRTTESGFPSFFWTIVVGALCWIILPGGFYIGTMFLLAALLEKQSHIPVEIGLDASGITFNHFPTKSFEWRLIQRCLVKDGILTIDYRTNRLYQREISSDILPEDEKELNAYCEARILESIDAPLPSN